MVLSIIEYIGQKVLEANPYIDVFGANCIKVKGGQIVNFVGAEKEDFSPSDIAGIGTYVRIEPTIEYSETNQKTSSCKQSVSGSIKFRFVLFQVNPVNNILNPAKIENKIWADLLSLNFNEYVGNESKIRLFVYSSNLNFYDNFVQEVGKDYEVGANSIIIALNCSLSWVANSDSCPDCSITESSSILREGVFIKDQNGNTIAVVDCGGTYDVFVWAGIDEGDSTTIYADGITDQ